MRLKMQVAEEEKAPVSELAENGSTHSETQVGSDQLEVSLSAVHRRPDQVRKYFDPEEIANFARELERDGIRSALWVRPLPGGRPGEYELIAGERRYRAAQLAGLQTVPIRVFDLDDDEVLDASLVENMQRSDLNPIEETEGILDLLCRRLQQTRAEVVGLLNRKAHLDKNGVTNSAVRNSNFSPTDSAVRNQWETVEEIFTMLGRITPDGFRTHRLPLLNLPGEILEALRHGKIEYTKARAIATVKDPQKRQWLLDDAITHNLTLRQIQERVRELSPRKTPEPIGSRLTALGKKAVSSPALQNAKTKARVEQLIAELTDLLEG